MRRNREDKGSALLISLVCIIILIGMGGAFLVVVLQQTTQVVQSGECLQGFYTTEAVVAEAISRLNEGTLVLTDMGAGWQVNDNGTQTGIDDFTELVGGACNAGHTLCGQWPFIASEHNVEIFGNFDVTVRLEDVDPGVDNDVYRVRVSTTAQAVGNVTKPLTRQIDVVIARYPRPAAGIGIRGAITSNGPVQTLGGIAVDGRDHNMWGMLNGLPGTFGISSTQKIANGGASAVGGNGLAPEDAAADKVDADTGESLVNEPNADWSTYDTDMDGTVGDDPADGVDNDGDGLVDEDTGAFYASPDAVLGLAPGSLLNAAENSSVTTWDGTTYDMHFQTVAEWNDFLRNNGGMAPGGKVIYLDFQGVDADGNPNGTPVDWMPAELGQWWYNHPPSILVHHPVDPVTGAAIGGELKNLHGYFKGLMLADGVDHVNAGTQILGAMVSFASYAPGNAFGNGDSDVYFSSEVLAQLPNVDPNDLAYAALSWTESSDTTSMTTATSTGISSYPYWVSEWGTYPYYSGSDPQVQTFYSAVQGGYNGGNNYGSLYGGNLYGDMYGSMDTGTTDTGTTDTGTTDPGLTTGDPLLDPSLTDPGTTEPPADTSPGGSGYAPGQNK